MLIAASVTGAFIAGLVLSYKRKRQKAALRQSSAAEIAVDGHPVRNMKFTMG